MKKIRKVVIPAAGMGTRFLPATKAQPKEMLPIVDKPAIQYIIEEALAAGMEEILIITGRNKRAIEDHFDRSIELEMLLKEQGKEELYQIVREIADVPVHYVRQKEALGLGHAIFSARQFVGDEPFAVMLGDDIVDSDKPCLEQLLEVYKEYGRSILGVQEVSDAAVSSYGIVQPQKIKENLWLVEGLVEKPDVKDKPSNLAILGRYIIQPEIFTLLEHAKPGKNGEIQLTDSLLYLARKEPMYAYEFSGKRYDIGNKEGFLQATVDFALKEADLRESFLRYINEVVKREIQ